MAYTLEKSVFGAATFKGLWVISFQTKRKNVLYTLVCLSSLCISRVKKTKQILFVRGKFSFLYEYICVDVIKCKFFMKKSSLKCWLCFHLFLWRTRKKGVPRYEAPSDLRVEYVQKTQ